ncbi:MAG: hypothetical protein J2P26_10370 [Nocardiopsaceae bacterium]|nr:hypothetical protein [Nocardiopsaceae bacterium]
MGEYQARHESHNIHYIHFATGKSHHARPPADSAPAADAVAYVRSALAGVRARLASVGVDQRDLDIAITEALADLGPGPATGPTTGPVAGMAGMTALPPAIPDTPGQDLRPDPGEARTAAEFLDCLRNYRTWAGNPSYRVMARRCRHRFAASTICTALRGESMPSLDMVLAIVAACGGPESHQREFASAWRRLILPDPREPDPREPDPHHAGTTVPGPAVVG